ncbi:C4-dicarboxylate ABC transporter [Mycobacterium sp. MS1601]|uniref:SLC13 family permease n=1 Tax=Mycobacterium sp. MS1601 TaxID=1936029 RepID=UPI000979543D|nr:SLC13 family permease [Mycobacterium sp. MS1601]AQA02373.1 C4-dicarboxylate ABC transporter [Mycobacterium sp. MS1601]
MTMSLLAFGVLVAAFAIGSFTPINAGLIATVSAFIMGILVFGLPTKDVIAQFPSGLFFILVGATLLFGIMRVNGTIDLLAYWAERAAGGRRHLIPVMMFLLTAALCSAGAFTPAAVAIVAPVALGLAKRFGISTLAMGLVIVQGANAGAFSPVNPFGVLSNQMLADAGAAGDSGLLYIYCFLFNAVLAVLAYLAVQTLLKRRKDRRDLETRTYGATAPEPDRTGAEPDGAGSVGTATAVKPDTVVESTSAVAVAVTPVRLLTLAALVALLILTTVLGIDVGVASLILALVLIVFQPGVQKQAIDSMPWSAILLVTGIVTYIGVMEEIGALEHLQSGISSIENPSLTALIASYVVGVISAFASTTGTLGVVSPLIGSIAMDPSLSPLGVITAISISSSVVDVSPMSTTGALLMASATSEDERTFFKALLLWAILMIGVVPLIAWLIFV